MSQNVALYICYLLFILLNGKILLDDIKYKKISNTSIVGLFILFLVYIFLFSSVSAYSSTYFFQFILTFCITFCLYVYKIWGAGDAKYLLVLSLFLIGSSNIITFLLNTSLVTILYLFSYLIYFYTWKCFRNKNLRNGLIFQIKQTYIQFKKQERTKTKNQIINFLIIFTGIRILRWYLIAGTSSQESISFLGGGVYLFQDLNISYSIIFIILLFLIIFLIGKICIKSFFFIGNKYGYSIDKVMNILQITGISILMIFLLYEGFKDIEGVVHMLGIIFTLYITFFILFKMFSWMVHTGISGSEKYLVSINNLKPGMIVDGKNMKSLLGNKKELLNIFGYDIKTKILDIEDINKIRKIVKYSNKNIQVNKKQESFIKSLIIIDTFAYSPFIFSGFIVTYLFQDKLISFIVEGIKLIIIF